MHKPMPRILAFPGPGYALPKTEMQPSRTMGSKGSSPTLILIPVMEELPFQVARKEGRLRKSSRLSTTQPVEHKARAVVLKGERSEFTRAPSTGLLWSPSFRKWVPASQGELCLPQPHCPRMEASTSPPPHTHTYKQAQNRVFLISRL